MRLKVENVHTAVLTATSAEHAFLYNLLSFEEKQARFMKAFQHGRWDGRVRLYNRLGNYFPSGLLFLVKKKAAERSLPLEVLDSRSRVEPESGDTAWLDPVREQPQALDACLEKGRGIVWAGTGMGKTEVMCGLGIRIPGNWLVLVHKKDLLYQTAERFEKRTGESAGRCGDGVWDPARFTVATFQTLSRYLKNKDPRARKLLLSADGLIADECHVAPSDSFYGVMNGALNAYWRFGFSGTPLDRSDRKNVLLIAATGPVVYHVGASKLVQAGVLSKPKIRFVKLEQTVPGQTWNTVYRNGIVLSEPRNSLLVRMAKVAEKPCLMIVKEIDHGKELARRLEQEGVKSEFVWGSDSAWGRQDAIRRVCRGDTDVLVSSTIFDEGVDIPDIRSVIIAAGGRSIIKSLQRLGRGMRTTQGKSEVELWDVQDVGRSQWLRNHARERMKTYKAEGFDVESITKWEDAA